MPEGLATISHKSIRLEAKKADKLRFVSPQEREDYFYMKANIAKNDRLSQKGISNMLRHIFYNRQHFCAQISLKDKFEQWLHKVICCKFLISAERRVKVHRH